MTAIALALAASVAWGTADFLAATASRRLALLTVLVVSQSVGLAIAILGVLATGAGAPDLDHVALGALAGVLNAIALLALYRGLAVGPIGIVAPIAATDALLPLALSWALGEAPNAVGIGGAALAIAGIVVIALPGRGGEESAARGRMVGVTLALVAAVGFGTFVLALDGASEGGVAWAVLVTRIASVAVLLPAALITGAAAGVRLARRDLALLGSVGVLDIAATGLLAVATVTGLIGEVGVLASLYPVVTILLARIVLGERLTAVQRTGSAGVLAGVAVLAIV